MIYFRGQDVMRFFHDSLQYIIIIVSLGNSEHFNILRQRRTKGGLRGLQPFPPPIRRVMK